MEFQSDGDGDGTAVFPNRLKLKLSQSIESLLIEFGIERLGDANVVGDTFFVQSESNCAEALQFGFAGALGVVRRDGFEQGVVAQRGAGVGALDLEIRPVRAVSIISIRIRRKWKLHRHSKGNRRLTVFQGGPEAKFPDGFHSLFIRTKAMPLVPIQAYVLRHAMFIDDKGHLEIGSNVILFGFARNFDGFFMNKPRKISILLHLHRNRNSALGEGGGGGSDEAERQELEHESVFSRGVC